MNATGHQGRDTIAAVELPLQSFACKNSMPGQVDTNWGALKMVSEESDIILECKICKNLFRSADDFISHKTTKCISRHEQVPCSSDPPSKFERYSQEKFSEMINKYHEFLARKRAPGEVEQCLDNTRKPVPRQPFYNYFEKDRTPKKVAESVQSAPPTTDKSRKNRMVKAQCLCKCHLCPKILFNKNFFKRHLRLKHGVDMEVSEMDDMVVAAGNGSDDSQKMAQYEQMSDTSSTNNVLNEDESRDSFHHQQLPTTNGTKNLKKSKSSSVKKMKNLSGFQHPAAVTLEHDYGKSFPISARFSNHCDVGAFQKSSDQIFNLADKDHCLIF